MVLAPLSYEYERDDYYCYPNSSVLKNELGIAETRIVSITGFFFLLLL